MPVKLGELIAATDEDLLPDISFLSPEQQDRYSELADKLLADPSPITAAGVQELDLPEIAATALAQYLLSLEHGGEKVRDVIVDDIRHAQLNGGDKEHVLTLLHVLHHFLKTHPEARPSTHPWSKRF